MESAPGEEAQIDFGTGAPYLDSEGKKRRTHVLRVVLNESVPPIAIQPEEAKDAVGKMVEVAITIQSVRFSKLNEWLYLNSKTYFRDPKGLAITIRFPTPERLKAMGLDEETKKLVGRKIRVTGKVTIYRDMYQIIVNQPNQISLIP